MADYLMTYPFIPEPSDFALKSLHELPKHQPRVNLEVVEPRRKTVGQHIRQQMDDVVIRERVCKHCKGTYNGTAYGFCSRCGRFQ